MKKRGISLLLAAATAASVFGTVGCAEEATEGEITVYTALEDEQVTEYLAVFNEE